MKVIIGDREYNVIKKESDTSVFTVNNKEERIDSYSPKKNFLHILHNNKSYKAELIDYNAEEKNIVLKVNNNRYHLKLVNETDELLEKLGISNKTKKIPIIKAPMPGLVLDIRVKDGDSVNKGDALLVLEAMKMENLIKADAHGKIKKVLILKGIAVEKNQPLIEME